MNNETDKKRSIDDIASNKLESSADSNWKRQKLSHPTNELIVTKDKVRHWTIIVKIGEDAESTHSYRIPTADLKNDTKITYYITHREELEKEQWAEYDEFMENTSLIMNSILVLGKKY